MAQRSVGRILIESTSAALVGGAAGFGVAHLTLPESAAELRALYIATGATCSVFMLRLIRIIRLSLMR